MPYPIKASDVSAALRLRLEQIKPVNGYSTDLVRAYEPDETVQDTAPKPYALIRPSVDTRTGLANRQATRVRQFEIEVVFSKSSPLSAMDAVHVDVLRALGIGQDLYERIFPGLIEDEDEATWRFAQKGETTHSITITIGVTYVETYN
ncbi:hypothetical protein [Pseudomonas sp. EA_35y_Pfl2_R111]|uniref:hypothetical protein n=1 Tax=Pseudomonas sp. EA_35y_Pfl2_R111 TaxID=3088689 RepID=UPI0030D79644